MRYGLRVWCAQCLFEEPGGCFKGGKGWLTDALGFPWTFPTPLHAELMGLTLADQHPSRRYEVAEGVPTEVVALDARCEWLPGVVDEFGRLEREFGGRA